MDRCNDKSYGQYRLWPGISGQHSRALGFKTMFSLSIRVLTEIDFDLEAGYDYILEKYKFIDGRRTVALGASFGGYMVSYSS